MAAQNADSELVVTYNCGMRVCSMEGCDTKHYARGWCFKHYKRWERTGTPEGVRPVYATVAERINATVDIDASGCWIWRGVPDKDGYRKTKRDGVIMYAHRLSYETFVGPIPEGMQLDHLCRVRACCNPEHLEPVTCRENIMRGEGLAVENVTKTHCPSGHEYTPENTYVYNGGRSCRECNRQKSREHQRKKREAAGPVVRVPVTHCLHGHEFTPENTIIRTNGNRACRECGRASAREYQRRKRAERLAA